MTRRTAEFAKRTQEVIDSETPNDSSEIIIVCTPTEVISASQAWLAQELKKQQRASISESVELPG